MLKFSSITRGSRARLRVPRSVHLYRTLRIHGSAALARTTAVTGRWIVLTTARVIHFTCQMSAFIILYTQICCASWIFRQHIMTGSLDPGANRGTACELL